MSPFPRSAFVAEGELGVQKRRICVAGRMVGDGELRESVEAGFWCIMSKLRRKTGSQVRVREVLKRRIYRSSDAHSPPRSGPASPGGAPFEAFDHMGNMQDDYFAPSGSGLQIAPSGSGLQKGQSLIKQTYSTTMTHPVTGKIKKFHVVGYSSKVSFPRLAWRLRFTGVIAAKSSWRCT